LDGTTVNAPDAPALAGFYSEITDGLAQGTSRWAAVSSPNGFIAVQPVDDFRPPTWPGSSVPGQLHLDFLVDDLDADGCSVPRSAVTSRDQAVPPLATRVADSSRV
jgi:hypothetical protein